MGFINSELSKCDKTELDENLIIDTIELAKKKFPGQSVSLDSLCRKYSIDLSDRKIHGALKDAKLLASVYLELIGGRQSKLEFEKDNGALIDIINNKTVNINDYYKNMPLKTINNIELDELDYKMHLKSIENLKNSIWKRIKN